MMRCLRAVWVCSLFLTLTFPTFAEKEFLTFETGQVRPLAVSPDNTRLFAVNTPDNRLEIFDIDSTGTLTPSGSLLVGMEPVAVAARTDDEIWVVNRLSDSVSIVDTSGAVPRVTRTLLIGDEPSDIVFAGPGGNRAFITTAHRGQNSPFPRGEFETAGIGRADVWVFDAAQLGSSLGGDPLTIITLFGDVPRALATSPDGSTVYAGIFHSGNQTTTVTEELLCDTSQENLNTNGLEGPCVVNGLTVPGGYPPPHKNFEGLKRPETGLIVQFNRNGVTSNQWLDELGRDWTAAVNFSLPDKDVFQINANVTPPIETGTPWSGVGTTLFNMVTHPSSGKIYVSNTEAQNHVRFEGPGTVAAGVKPPGEPASVRGNLAHSRITVLDAGNVTVRHLNKHIPYDVTPVPAGVKENSLAIPLGMAISADGSTLYVAAFGSQKIGIFDTTELEDNTFIPDSADHISLSGGGPSGIVLAGDYLYAMTRFNNSVSVVSTASKNEIQVVPLFNPEPPQVINGRPFLYDAVLTGSNGESVCASCHIFGDTDHLAWDLGNPDGALVSNPNPFNPTSPVINRVFHPMKGPMGTQSMRGLENAGPEHWRGDRTGDANAAFEAFNVAFPGLVGRDEGVLLAAEMQAFVEFAMEIIYPPNPIRQLDNSLRSDESLGLTLFSTPGTNPHTPQSCIECHTVQPLNGFYGTSGLSNHEGSAINLKVPHLRNLYQKVGMFGAIDLNDGVQGPFTHQGDQVRSFGFTHDGPVDTLNRFASGFNVPHPTGEEQLASFLMSFPADLAPIVGQQVTIHPGNFADADTNARIDLMIARASTPFESQVLGGTVTECDLIATVVLGSLAIGFNRRSDGLFEPDTGASPISEGSLRLNAQTSGQEVTYTCVPPGSGSRVGIDRDSDELGNNVETNTGVFVDALDAGTDPTRFDTDEDGVSDGEEVNAQGTNPLLPDTDSDGLLDGFEITNGFDPITGGEEVLDSDGDGLNNLQEQTHGTNPLSSDTDSDGLSDGDEINHHGTDPALADTDGDSFDDGTEVAEGTDPLDPNDHPAFEVPMLRGLGLSLLGGVLMGTGYRSVRGKRKPL